MQPTPRKSRLFTWVAVAFAILIIVIMSTSKEKDDSAENGSPSDSAIQIAAEIKVKKFLKAPGSADFSIFVSVHPQTTPDVWAVIGSVDAQNSFGATLRSEYIAAIRLLCKSYFDSRCWELVKLSIGDKILVNKNLSPPKPDPDANKTRDAKKTAAKEAAALKQLIRTVQLALIRLGYSPGPADGKIGSRTKAAIIKYQRNNGLKDAGELTEQFLDHIGE